MNVTMMVDTLWVLLAAVLVFFMNLGFAAVESGFARSKNTVNILSKNFIVFAVSSLGFMLLGWGLMFGGDNPVIGTENLFILGNANLDFYADTLTSNVPFWGKFFQLVFAAPPLPCFRSGCRAYGIYPSSFSFVLTLVIYPRSVTGGRRLAPQPWAPRPPGDTVISLGRRLGSPCRSNASRTPSRNI